MGFYCSRYARKGVWTGATIKDMEKFEDKNLSTIEQEYKPERIRISVANIVQYLRVEGSDKVRYFGVLSPSKFRKGERQFQPLGGGAEITPEAKAKLEDLGAEFEAGMDARFTIPADEFEDVYAKFAGEAGNFFERDVERELHEELCDEEIPGMPSVLSKEEAGRIKISYAGVVSQVPVEPKLDTSPNTASVPSRRLFHIFELTVPADVYEKMTKSEALHFYSEEEVKEVRSKGVNEKVYTESGDLVSNNTFLVEMLPME